MATLGALPAAGLNGAHDGHFAPAAVPDADSPQTPVNNALVDDVKIDIDQFEPESDARHEPVLVKPTLAHTLSTQPQIGTPVDPDSIPILPPNGTPPPPAGELLPDVEMAEQADPSPPAPSESVSVVASVVEADEAPLTATVTDATAQPPVTPPPPSGPASEGSFMDTDAPPNGESAAPNGHQTTAPLNLRRSADEMDAEESEAMDTEEHPAKRARMNPDDDEAKPLASEDPVANGPNGPAASATATASTFSSAQHKFCASTVRTLKKLKDSAPFLRPVDPVALNIPHYPSIVKHPMDFSTIERKLASSNPTKPDPNPENPRYYIADEFVADVRLIFNNSLIFNGPDHAVSQMGKRVEAVFDKQIKQLPPPDEPKPPVVAKAATPTPPPAAATVKKPPARRPSTSVPVIRRNEAETVSTRPKREIHPPPPKDLPYSDPPKKPVRRVRKPKDASTMLQLQFCSKVLAELHKKQHWNIAHPFYDPVDWVALNLPNYPKVVKKPMDLATMRKRLDGHEYGSAQKFYDDFKLMIRNCFAFNPAGTPVNQAGIDLQRVFDEKWKGLPRKETEESEPEDEEEEEEEDDDRARAIAMIENQIATMRDDLAALKGGAPKPKEPKKKKEKREKYVPPVASTSKAPPKPKAAPAPSKKKASATSSSKKAPTDDDVLSFEQKKELSEAIGQLDDQKLERVIQIIHEGVPEIRDSTEEIELEIDTLPASVLTKLYNFVIRPLKAGPKRSRVPKGGGTGGLKRKSMDEDVEAEKIRQLEERMRLFEEGAGGHAAAGPPVVGPDSDGSSDSSSDESSDSD